jgi:UDP-N-acetylglucosamine--N-acetylmuramyl-(pentapeptide) pyrophosphoryl-undecaprenol N-acetylglucosamine transferase
MILITGGGTGGHLAIAKAFKEELIKKDIKPIYVGSTIGQDKQWFENDKDFSQKYFLASTGVVNKSGFAKIKAIFNMISQTFKAIKIIKENNIEKVICVGGFSSAPASFAAVILKKELFIHEQNSVVGKLNSILRPYAKEFFSSYDEESKVKDYPIKDIFFQKQRVREKIETIIFLGGSQGARNINNFAMTVAKKLDNMGIKIIHQTGQSDYQEVIAFYKKEAILADVFVFSKNLEEKITQADFAISRAGASTLWESCANGLPTLFVPYPYAAADHQYYNAKFLEEKELA